MAKKDSIVFEGVVLKCLPSSKFIVELENKHKITAHLSGKMRMYNIRVIDGDKVTIEMSPYDLDRGRITYRTK
jgi:translation initiation factor IF-1